MQVLAFTLLRARMGLLVGWELLDSRVGPARQFVVESGFPYSELKRFTVHLRLVELGHVTARCCLALLARKKATEGAKPPALDCTETRARRGEVTTADAAASWHMLPTAGADTAMVVSTGSAWVTALARAMYLTTSSSANASESSVYNVETPVCRHCKLKLLEPSGTAVQCAAASVTHLLIEAALDRDTLPCQLCGPRGTSAPSSQETPSTLTRRVHDFHVLYTTTHE